MLNRINLPLLSMLITLFCVDAFAGWDAIEEVVDVDEAIVLVFHNNYLSNDHYGVIRGAIQRYRDEITAKGYQVVLMYSDTVPFDKLKLHIVEAVAGAHLNYKEVTGINVFGNLLEKDYPNPKQSFYSLLRYDGAKIFYDLNNNPIFTHFYPTPYPSRWVSIQNTAPEKLAELLTIYKENMAFKGEINRGMQHINTVLNTLKRHSKRYDNYYDQLNSAKIPILISTVLIIAYSISHTMNIFMGSAIQPIFSVCANKVFTFPARSFVKNTNLFNQYLKQLDNLLGAIVSLPIDHDGLLKIKKLASSEKSSGYFWLR